MRAIVIAVLIAAGCTGSQPKATTKPVAAAESKLELCVIDTIAPGGMMTIGAIRVHATGDTVILQSSGRVPVQQVVRGPRVLTVKEPFQLTAASGRLRFAPTGGPRVYAAGKIALLGMMRGLPIFALPSEGGVMRAELEALSARGVDLEKALAQRVTLRRQLNRIKTLYIPTSLIGCTFQQFTKAQRRR